MLAYIFYFSRVPTTVRANPGFKTTYVWYIAKTSPSLIITHAYSGLSMLFASVPKDYQWIIGLLSPLAETISFYILRKASEKPSGSNGETKPSVKLRLLHYVITKHEVFLAVIVGNIATTLTTYTVIAMDFAIMTFKAWKIIRYKKKGKNVSGEYNRAHLVSNT